MAEGVAYRTSDIDVVYVYGYGFPAYRGGPMHYGERRGLDKVLEKINQFAETYGREWWAPAPLLEHAAKEGKTFAEMEKTS